MGNNFVRLLANHVPFDTVSTVCFAAQVSLFGCNSIKDCDPTGSYKQKKVIKLCNATHWINQLVARNAFDDEFDLHGPWKDFDSRIVGLALKFSFGFFMQTTDVCLFINDFSWHLHVNCSKWFTRNPIVQFDKSLCFNTWLRMIPPTNFVLKFEVRVNFRFIAFRSDNMSQVRLANSTGQS